MATGIPKSNANGAYEAASRTVRGNVRLTYEGKRDAAEILAHGPKTHVSVVHEPQRRGWANRLYFGDNFPILRSLLDDACFRGQVSLVYIDPPYATNSVFESREQKLAYEDLLFGAPFVEFLRERLVLIRELLSDRGSIYVHLDGNMAFEIKVVLDEIFGAENFRNFITRKKCNTKNYTRRTYGNISDYILFYSKSDGYVWNRPVIEWSDESAKKEYTYVEAATGRRFKKVPIHAPGVRNGETGKPWRGMLPPPGKHWQFPPSVLEEMDRRGEIFWSSNGNPRRKIYLDDSDGVPVQDIWLDFKDAHNQNIEVTGYPTEKNIEMLEQIINASSNPGDLVLDAFAGSGTTLVAAENLGRRWIGIDNSKEAIRAIVNRLRFGSRPMGDYVSKKQVKKADDSLELFQIDAEPAVESARTITTENFCVYATAPLNDVEAGLNSVLALKEEPFTQTQHRSKRRVSYRTPRQSTKAKRKD